MKNEIIINHILNVISYYRWVTLKEIQRKTNIDIHTLNAYLHYLTNSNIIERKIKVINPWGNWIEKSYRIKRRKNK